ncbi:MAG: hypothetical protein AAGG46_01050 [Planctomycetota bacterium]
MRASICCALLTAPLLFTTTARAQQHTASGNGLAERAPRAVVAPQTPAVGDDPFDEPGEGTDSAAAPVTRSQAFGTAASQSLAAALRDGGVPTRIWASPHQAANDPVRRVLQAPLPSAGFDFAETPLEEVVQFVRDEYDLNVQIDTPALDDLGITVDAPVTCSLKGITLGAALRLMLREQEIVAVPLDGYLLLTTEEEEEMRLCVAVYPVADLVVQNGRNAIMNAVVYLVASETWAQNGGGESDLLITPTGLLIVSQTESVHDGIVALLEAMRCVPSAALADPRTVRHADALQNEIDFRLPAAGSGSGCMSEAGSQPDSPGPVPTPAP